VAKVPTKAWDGRNLAPSPDAGFRRGYDIDTGSKQATDKGANAWLSDDYDNTHVLLIVTATVTDLSLAGSTAQSVLQRDFYARNFTQPTFQIQCIAPSQQQYGKIAEFIHKAQRNAVLHGSLMHFALPSGGLRNTAARERSGSSKGKRGMRGRRKGLSLFGYVASVQRNHRRHDPAPQFSFEFVISRMQVGPFQDQPYRAYKIARWSDIVEDIINGNLVKAPKTIEEQQQKDEFTADEVDLSEVISDPPPFDDIGGGDF